MAPTSNLTGVAARRLRTPDHAVLRWLATTLASYLELPPTAIDPKVPLAEMGVDSVHAVSLVGDIEVHFDIDVDPTLIFDYPTLSHIADYISAAVAEQRVVA
ncbi:acyl carrier protein [Mycobacteriaceae bacterium 1482268.1]|nr:acyl carrier protein [Mycobacteriaceae bacterium 1482268.1]